MKIQVKPNVKEFELEAGEDGAVIGVRTASEGDYIELSSLFQKREIVMFDEDGEQVIRADFNPRVVNRKAAYLTLAYIRNVTDENGAELFRSDLDPVQGERISAAMSESQFDAAWSLLPTEVCDRIARHVFEINPGFSR